MHLKFWNYLQCGEQDSSGVQSQMDGHAASEHLCTSNAHPQEGVVMDVGPQLYWITAAEQSDIQLAKDEHGKSHMGTQHLSHPRRGTCPLRRPCFAKIEIL